MRRRKLLALSGTALTTAVAGCSSLGGSDSDPTTGEPTTDPTETDSPTDTDTPNDDTDLADDLRNGSFEDDWATWTVGRHLPDDPNVEGDRKVASGIGVTSTDASDGTTCLRGFIDGSQDDGTVWVQQPVDLSDHDHLAVDYRVTDSFNEILQAAVYVGPSVEGGLSEVDFDRSNSLSGHRGKGWKTFVYDVDHDGPGVVAVGFNIVWETGASGLLDNVRLTADDPETVQPPTRTETPTDGGDDSGSI
jgi:hypothetical protein